MPALDLLDVRENRIPEAAKIAPAASLPELIILRVRGNPLCDEDAYADAILGTQWCIWAYIGCMGCLEARVRCIYGCIYMYNGCTWCKYGNTGVRGRLRRCDSRYVPQPTVCVPIFATVLHTVVEAYIFEPFCDDPF